MSNKMVFLGRIISNSKEIVGFLEKRVDFSLWASDNTHSRPAKPLPVYSGMLKCGGFFFLLGVAK